MKSLTNNAESFTPTADKIETLPDGRTIQVAVKGVPMPIAEAQRLGLITEPEPEVAIAASDSAETPKAKQPTFSKLRTPAENK